jgi:hypothetical protein
MESVEELPQPPQPPAGDGSAKLEIRVRELEQQLESIRAEHRAEIERILSQLGEMSSSIRSRL